MGPDSLGIFNGFNISIDTINYKEIFNHFFAKKQGANESIDEYGTSLKNLNMVCELG